MGIGVGIFLIALGAILTFAIDFQTSGIDLDVVGVILMIVGLIGIFASFVLFGDNGYYGRSPSGSGGKGRRRSSRTLQRQLVRPIKGLTSRSLLETSVVAMARFTAGSCSVVSSTTITGRPHSPL